MSLSISKAVIQRDILHQWNAWQKSLSHGLSTEACKGYGSGLVAEVLVEARTLMGYAMTILR